LGLTDHHAFPEHSLIVRLIGQAGWPDGWPDSFFFAGWARNHPSWYHGVGHVIGGAWSATFV
jgi:hypothetical protein